MSMSAIHIRGDVLPLLESNIASIRGVLQILFAAVTVVLLVACINVAGLLLVRAIRRRREYAIRLALGAQPNAIVRESILEGLLLSFTGALLGVALTAATLRIAVRLLPETMPRLSSIVMDGRVLTFAVALAIITGVGCSLAPLFAALRTNLTDTLKDGNLAGTGAESHTRLRSAFIMAEIAVALVLLSVSGMFLRSLQKMHEVDLGFSPDHVLVSAYQLSASQYSSNLSVQAFNTAVTEKLSGLPGTIAAGITDSLPSTDRGGMAAFTIEGRPAATWKLQFAGFASVDGDYFHAMDIRLLRGRTFTVDDRSGTSPVVIVSESMAKHSWPGQSAIGRRLHAGNPRKRLPWATVVGIVADTKMGSRDEPGTDQWYVPVQQPATLYGLGQPASATESTAGYIILRSQLAPEQMVSILRAAVAQIDPQLALQGVEPMTNVISKVEAPRRFNTGLITGFALGAFLLAVTGIYTVVAFSVSLRRHEIAIRMALGAQRGDIVRAVFLSGAKLALFGSAFGLLGSLAVSRLVRSFLFEVSTADPAVHAAAVLVMMLAALVASALPARRASSANPAEALRST